MITLEITNGKGNDYITGCVLDKFYFQKKL